MVLEYVAYEGGKDDFGYIASIEYYVRARQLAMLFVLERYAKARDKELYAAVSEAIEQAIANLRELAPYADNIAETLNFLNRSRFSFRIEEKDGKITTTVEAPEGTVQVTVSNTNHKENDLDDGEQAQATEA